jgi:hypothetical protein
LIRACREGGDRLVEEVDVGEDLADEQGVVAGEAALERFAQRRQLGAQASACQLGEQVGVVGAADERLEHRPPGDAEHVARDRGELDPCVLEHLVEPLHLARALLDLRLPVAGQVAQLADRARRYEARADEPVLSSWQIQAASATSVLRPGTLRRCWAFKSQHSR